MLLVEQITWLAHGKCLLSWVDRQVGRMLMSPVTHKLPSHSKGVYFLLFTSH